MDYSKERRVTHLRGVAQALDDENRRLREERAEFDARLAALITREQEAREAAQAEIVRARLAQAAAEAEAARSLRAQHAAEAEVERAGLAQLEAEVEAAHGLHAQLLAEVEAAWSIHLQQETEEQRAQIARLLAGRDAELAVLREVLALREQQLYGKKTERRPSQPTEGAPEAEAPKRKKKAKKKQKGHGPTAQPDLAKVDVNCTLVGKGLACGNCGGTLAPLGTEAEEAELIAIEARKIVLERIVRAKYQCPCCRQGVTTAPGPVRLIPGGRYALSFTLEVAFMKYMAHLPFERQAQMFRHEGLKVTTAALYDQVDALATALTPTYQAIWAALQKEAVLCADETPWAVLSNGHTANERFYAWCAVGSQYVGYRLLDTRSAEGAAFILGAFNGTLMVDGLTSYPAAAKGAPGEAPKFIIANCHAHARRRFLECEKNAPVEAKFVIDLYKELYAVEREGKEAGADLAALRQERSRPLVDKLFAWAKTQQARRDLLPSTGLAKAIAYLLNHETGLRTFLDNPAVPIDNNPAERAMRAPVLGRKNHYGSRSRRGTETAAILYTLVESAKRVGVSPKAYLEAAVEVALSKAGAVLLPDEFKRQLDEARAAMSTAAN